MSSKTKRFFYLIAIFNLFLLTFTVIGCKEGTSSNPVGSIINPQGTDSSKVSVLDTSKLGSATYMLTGLVFSDSSKQPIGNANVKLFYIDSNSKKLKAGETLTTSEGKFFFMKLPAGLYSIETPDNLKQYASTTYVVQILDGGKQSPANPTIFLKTAVASTGISVVPVKAKISGSLYDASSKSKVANEVINLLSGGQIIATTVSSELGTFEFSDLGTGSYRVEVSKDSPLYSGKDFTVDINSNGVVIPPTLPTFLTPKTIENFSFTGIVKSISGTPIPNAYVRIFSASDTSDPTKSLSNTYTTPEGKFFFSGLGSGQFFLSAEDSTGNYNSTTTPVAINILPDGKVSPETPEILLTAKPNAVFSINGLVLLETKEPVSNLSLQLRKNSLNSLAISTSITSGNGTFSFSNLASGVYYITLNSNNSLYKPVIYPFTVNLLSDGSVSPTNPTILVKKIATANVAGLVKSESGNLLGNIKVDIHKDSLSSAVIDTSYTTGDGKFFFQNLTTGLYVLEATDANAAYSNNSISFSVSESGVVSPLTPTITMKSTASVGVSVAGLVKSESGNLLGNIKVDIHKDSLSSAVIDTSYTTSGGQFLFSNLTEGFYYLSLSDSSNKYSSTTFSFRILSDGSTSPTSISVTMELVPQATWDIAGYVSNSSNSPLSNIKIDIRNTNSTSPILDTTYTTGEGKFSFKNLSADIYFITAADGSANYKEKIYPIEISTNGSISPSNIQITLEEKTFENYTIAGVVKESGQIVSNIKTELRKDSSSSSVIDTTYTTGDGKFFFESLTSGRYFITIADGSTTYESQIYPVTILSDGTMSPAIAEISLVKKTTAVTYDITGKIYDAITGGPIEYAKCTLETKGSFMTDDNGGYEFYAVSPGIYKLTITKNAFETLETSIKINDDGTTSPTALNFPLVNDTIDGYGSIAGRIVDETNGNGMSGKIVRLYEWKYTPKPTVANPVEYDYEWNVSTSSLILTTRTNADNPATPNVDESGTFKLTHLKKTTNEIRYLIYIGEDKPTNIAPKQAFENRSGSAYTWSIIDDQDPNYITDIRNVTVESNKTTYWTNYEHEN